MKRRSQPQPKRDHEAEAIRRMTTLSLTETEMRSRLLADKAALEVRLKEVFQLRRDARNQEHEFSFLDDLIKSISAELRAVKAQLK